MDFVDEFRLFVQRKEFGASHLTGGNNRLLQGRIHANIVVCRDGKRQYAQRQSGDQRNAAALLCRYDREGCRGSGCSEADRTVNVVEWKSYGCQSIFGNRVEFRRSLFGDACHNKQSGPANPGDKKQPSCCEEHDIENAIHQSHDVEPHR